MSVAHLSHNIYTLPAATLRKNIKEPYVWGSGKRKGENGKRKGENGKVKTESGKVKGESGKRSFVSMSSVRQTKYGRSSYRLVREQRMMAKRKGENGKRKEQRGKGYQTTCQLVYLSTCLLNNLLVNQLFLLFFLIGG